MGIAQCSLSRRQRHDFVLPRWCFLWIIRRIRWQTIGSVWVNYSDLNMTSLESWELDSGNHPQMSLIYLNSKWIIVIYTDRVHYRRRILAAWGLTEVPWLIQLAFPKKNSEHPEISWLIIEFSRIKTSQIYKICLVVWHMNFMTFHILGISSSQLTKSYFSEG